MKQRTLWGLHSPRYLYSCRLVRWPSSNSNQVANRSNPSRACFPEHGISLLIDGIDGEGINHPLYGPNPEGIAIYSANGYVAVEIMRSIDRPRFASGNRDKGTSAENAATVQGTLAYYGTYTVDEAGKTLTEHVEGSTFPNLEGARRPIKVVQITDEVMTLELPIAQSTIPGQASYKTIQAIWKKLK